MKVAIQVAVFCLATTLGGPRYGNKTELDRMCNKPENRALCDGLQPTTTLSPLQRAQNRKADNLIERVDNWYKEWDQGKDMSYKYITILCEWFRCMKKVIWLLGFFSVFTCF